MVRGAVTGPAKSAIGSPEIAIIGAGPAGTVAAILLARIGRHVWLIEQHRFPRDKVCGECLSPAGIGVLRRLGLAERVAALGAVRLRRAVLHAPDGSSAELPLPEEMWGVSRRALDAVLLAAAREAGAVILQPVRCEQIEPESRLSLRLRNLADNSIECIEPQRVLLADGKGTLLPPRGASRLLHTGGFGIQAHFAGIDGPEDGVELYGLHGCYGGLCRIEDHQWNAAFAVPARRLRACLGDIPRLFAELLQENPALALRLGGARQTRQWLAAPLPRHPVRRKWPAGVIPIGNAAAAIEPIGGEGMGLAMRSAEEAAHLLDHEQHPDVLGHRFRKLWRWPQVTLRIAGCCFSSPALARWLAQALQSSSVQQLALRLIGKPREDAPHPPGDFAFSYTRSGSKTFSPMMRNSSASGRSSR